jgi:hypothetical protein
MMKIVMKTSVAASLLLTGCTEINKEFGFKDDNKGEQFLEEVIKDKTGVEVDFTPEASK